MPDELPPTFEAIAQYLTPVKFGPAVKQEVKVETKDGNIAGIVQDGSSKKKMDELEAAIAERF
jgi:hypothetical protein